MMKTPKNLIRAMRRLSIEMLLACSALLFTSPLQAQQIELLLKGGHVIDPKNGIDQKMDIAIGNGRVLQVSSAISSDQAKQVIDVSGLYVTPGLIDIHVHVFAGTNLRQQYMDGPNSLSPDGFTLRSGVTTVVDAGSAGWRSFPLFKKNIIDRSKTRVLAFLNIVGDGMGEYQQDSLDMDPYMAATVANYYKDLIVGFKVAHYGGLQWIPIDSAVAAGKLTAMPVMIDFRGLPPSNSIEDLFMKHLRPGDIFTHAFHKGQGAGPTAVVYKEAVVDDSGIVKPFVYRAQERGIVFDVGHGGNGFVFSQAIPAFRQGLLPNSISSDLHIGNMNAGMKDMANIMSKFLNMGMPLQDVIARSTWNPAVIIQRPDLGSLSVGSEADVAVFNLRSGDFGFTDSHGWKLEGTKKLEAELTIRGGKVEWDLNGNSAENWEVAP